MTRKRTGRSRAPALPPTEPGATEWALLTADGLEDGRRGAVVRIPKDRLAALVAQGAARPATPGDMALAGR